MKWSIILLTVLFAHPAVQAQSAVPPAPQQIQRRFEAFLSQKMPKLAVLMAKGQSGEALNAQEAKDMQEVLVDAAYLEKSANAPVCQVYPEGQSEVNERKHGFHLASLMDCNKLSPAELAKTHESEVSMRSSFGQSEAVVYRYPGTPEEEKLRVQKVQAIAKKWKEWESQQ